MTDKIKLVSKILDDKLAEDIVLIDFENSGPLCDYFIICSSKNQKHADSLVYFLKEGLLNKYDIEHIDDSDSSWQIVDLGDLIIHIFSYENREKYRLENLWSDHKIINL